MELHFTARKFKAHKEVRSHAVDAVKKLDRFYDGIIRGDIILSFERSPNSIKTAEINLHVFGGLLTAKEKSDDFVKSIDQAIEKLTQQLRKYKTKQRLKDKKTLRRIKEEAIASETGEEA